MAKMSGGEALAKSLANEGVEVVFGIPGIQIYGIGTRSRSVRKTTVWQVCGTSQVFA